MIDFLCPKCNSTKYVLESGKYVCKFCGEKFSQSELDRIKHQVSEQRKSIEAELNEKFTFKIKDEEIEKIFDNISDKIDNVVEKIDKFEKNFSTVEDIKNMIHQTLNGKIDLKDVENLIDSLSDIEDFGDHIASPLYSAIEQGLIKKLSYKNNKFVIDEEELNQIMSDEFHDSHYTLKVVDAKNGLVEMPPRVRFYKIGLSVKDANTAAKYWSIINKFRHREASNVNELQKQYPDEYSRRKLFKDIIVFFKTHNIYTKG